MKPPRPAYVPESHIYVPPEFHVDRRPNWRTRALIGALIGVILGALFLAAAAVMSTQPEQPAPTTTVTPTRIPRPPAGNPVR